MAEEKISAEKFIEVFRRLGSPTLVASELGYSVKYVNVRRDRIEKALGIKLVTHNNQRAEHVKAKHTGRIDVSLRNGMILVGGDCHYWPDDISTAHRAFVKFRKQFRPEITVINGDAFDGASISRHPRLGYEQRPTVKQEIDTVTERLTEIEEVSNGRMIWTLGNHDWRYESILAAGVPQMEGVFGMSLKDHFPRWEPCWSVMVNGSVKIKHRYKGGVHAAYNNTLHAGVTMVTNHLHHPNVQIFRDERGVRYGVDTGCIARVNGPQFGYIEDNTTNWGSGFAVLTIKDGKILPPELVQVWDEEEGIVTFRGALIEV